MTNGKLISSLAVHVVIMIKIKQPVFLYVLLILLGSNTIVFGQWIPLNGPYAGGVVNKINSKDSLLFACTESGLYHSISGSSIWSKMGTGLPSISISDIEFLGNDIFAASSGSKVFRSSDGGMTWVSSSNGITDTMITAVRSLGNKLFAGTYSQGLFVSSNNGLNWFKVSAVSGSHVKAIERYGSMIFVAIDGFGVYVSYNSGTSWTLSTATLSNYDFTSLAVDSTRVLVTSNGDSAYISFDTCKTWQIINYGAAKYARAAMFHCSDLYLSTFGGTVCKSSDNGVTWSSLSIGTVANVPIFDLHLHDTVILAGTMGSGIYNSFDSGISWSKNSNGIKGRFSAVSAYSSHIFAGTKGDGLYHSSDYGNTWTKSDSGLSEQFIYSLAKQGGDIYVGTLGGLYKSSDLGVSWSIIQGVPTGLVYAVEVINSRIYVGRSNSPYVYYSDNSGLTWQSMSVLTNWGCFSIGGTNNYVLVGSYASPYAAFSSNNGINWNYLSTLLITSSIYGTAFTPNYAIAGGSSIWRTNLTSPGNWTQSSIGWPLNTWVNCMKSINANVVLAGGNNGVYASTDQGATWIDFNNGLDYKAAFEVEENFGLLYLASNNGLWISPSISALQENSNFSRLNDLELYPNPAIEIVSIRWNPMIVSRKVEIFNSLGQVVYSSDVWEMNQTSVDVRSFPYGVYIIKVSGNAGIQFGRMLVH